MSTPNLDAIRARAMRTSVTDQTRADIFALLAEVERLSSLAQPRDDIARVLCRRIHRSLWPIESVPSDEEPCANCCEHTDAVLAYLTGGAS